MLALSASNGDRSIKTNLKKKRDISRVQLASCRWRMQLPIAVHFRKISNIEGLIDLRCLDDPRLGCQAFWHAFERLSPFGISLAEGNSAIASRSARGYSLISLCIFLGDNLPCSPRNACPRRVVCSLTRNPFPEWRTSGTRRSENETRSY